MNTPTFKLDKEIVSEGTREEWPDCEQVGTLSAGKFELKVEPLRATNAEYWNIRRIYYISARNKNDATAEALLRYKKSERRKGNIEICLQINETIFEIAVLGKQSRSIRYKNGSGVSYKDRSPFPYDPSKWQENLDGWTKIAFRYKR